jgi:hypothetical protein
MVLHPPCHAVPALPTYLFGCAPLPSIMGKLLSLSHKEKQSAADPGYETVCSTNMGGPSLGNIGSTLSPTSGQLPRYMKTVMARNHHPMHNLQTAFQTAVYNKSLYFLTIYMIICVNREL